MNSGQLPLECWKMICEVSELPELRALRQTCRSFNGLVDSTLLMKKWIAADMRQNRYVQIRQRSFAGIVIHSQTKKARQMQKIVSETLAHEKAAEWAASFTSSEILAFLAISSQPSEPKLKERDALLGSSLSQLRSRLKCAVAEKMKDPSFRDRIAALSYHNSAKVMGFKMGAYVNPNVASEE